MNSLIKASEFFDDGRDKREKENFQGIFFNGIDMSKRNSPISFIRSDFRGAKFETVKFNKNNFSNADFIDSTIMNSAFENCQFKYTEIYNSYFGNTNLSDSLFNSASLVKLIFENCELNNLKFGVNTFRECKFLNCKLIDSNFDKDSMDDVAFEKTYLKNVDLSNMTAINLYFSDCKFDNVIIDADYIGSYFFKGVFFDDLKLKYRGKFFNLDIKQSDLLNNLFKIFLEKERFYEAINIIVQKNLLENKQSSIFPVVQIVSERLLDEKSQLKRSYQFDKIFTLLEYYLNTGYVSISDYFKILKYLENLDITHFDFFEQINFSEKINRLKIILNKIDLEIPFIESIDSNEKVLLEIKIDEKDRSIFEEKFNRSIIEIGKSLSIEEVPYKIIGERKGSLIYDIILYSGVALLFLKMLKLIVKEARGVIHESVHFAIDFKSDRKVLKITEKLKGKNQLEQINEIKEYQIKSKKLIQKEPNKQMDEMLQLATILKSATIYPNALNEGDSIV